MERRERHLGRAHEVEVVLGRRVELRLVGRQHPVPYIASSRTSTGGITGANPLSARMSIACRINANCTNTRSPSR